LGLFVAESLLSVINSDPPGQISLVSEALASGNAAPPNDLEQAFRDLTMHEELRKMGMRAAAVVPLKVGGVVV